MSHIRVIVRDSESNAIIDTLTGFNDMDSAFTALDEYWENLSEEEQQYTEATIERDAL